MSGKKYTKKSTKRTKSTKVDKLEKKVMSLVKLNKVAVQKQFLNASGNISLAAPANFINLLNYPACVSIFGTSGVDYTTTNKWIHKKSKMDFVFSASNETANIDINMYVVSLKDEANHAYDKTTGSLTLVSGQDYVINIASNNAGQTVLNPKVFNTHYQKRIIIGNNNVAITEQTQYTRRRVYHTLNMNKTIINPIGNVSSLVASQDPSKQYYVLFFNNNSNIDSEAPTVEYNITHELMIN